MNWLLMKKIGLLFCFKVSALVTWSYTYVHWAACNEATAQNFPCAVVRFTHTAMPPPPPSC